MRLELAGGQWADLRDRLTYAQAREIRVVYFRAQRDPEAAADYDLTVVRSFVTAWQVLDFDGKAVSLDTPELAPDPIVQAIFNAGVGLLPEAMAVPKAGGETSPILPPAPKSKTSTTNSGTSSSWPTIPDGVGPI